MGDAATKIVQLECVHHLGTASLNSARKDPAQQEIYGEEISVPAGSNTLKPCSSSGYVSRKLFAGLQLSVFGSDIFKILQKKKHGKEWHLAAYRNSIPAS